MVWEELQEGRLVWGEAREKECGDSMLEGWVRHWEKVGTGLCALGWAGTLHWGRGQSKKTFVDNLRSVLSLLASAVFSQPARPQRPGT